MYFFSSQYSKKCGQCKSLQKGCIARHVKIYNSSYTIKAATNTKIA